MCDVAGVKVSGSFVMDQRVTTEWCQTLRSSKNAKPSKRHLLIDTFCVAGSSSSKVLEALADYSVKISCWTSAQKVAN